MSTSKNRHTSYGPTMTLDGNYVASFPPTTHTWRTDSQGILHVYPRVSSTQLSADVVDGRPSKLRDAMSRLEEKKQLADLNQRNRERYNQGGKNK